MIPIKRHTSNALDSFMLVQDRHYQVESPPFDICLMKIECSSANFMEVLMVHDQPRTWERDFSFQGKKLFYNRILYNHISERCVEIPIAFDFLANLKNK